jgi:L-serine deaminase
VTALLAEMKINIASLVLSRKSRSGQASMVIELDSAISEDMLKRILSSSNAIARAFVLPVKGDEC